MPQEGAAPGKSQPISVARPAARIEELIDSTFAEDLLVAAGHGSLNEDLALALLSRRDLPQNAIETLAKNPRAVKHRKVMLQIVQHPRTPRHVVLPMLRRLFVFELMQVALAPAVAADLKLVAEEMLIGKLETLSLGECINLARRASSRVAGALLLHSERAVVEAALQNPHTTEASVLRSLANPDVSLLLLSMLTHHPKWSLRREIQIAILRRRETTDDLVLEIAHKLPQSAMRDLIERVKLPQSREALLRKLEQSQIP